MAVDQEIRKKIEQRNEEEKRLGRVNYETTAFLLKKPHSNRVEMGPFRLPGREAHRKLLALARDRGMYVWYGGVEKHNGKDCLVGPTIIDWDSVPGQEDDRAGRGTDEYACPDCGKVCSSTSGLTLHMKSCAGQPENDAGEALTCDTCGKVCSSTSGLTLHKQHAGH